MNHFYTIFILNAFQRTLSDLQYRIKLERAIKLAKQRIGEGTNGESEQQGTFRQMTWKLLGALELIRDAKNDQLLGKAGKVRP